jgi:hypothetical protein
MPLGEHLFGVRGEKEKDAESLEAQAAEARTRSDARTELGWSLITSRGMQILARLQVPSAYCIPWLARRSPCARRIATRYDKRGDIYLSSVLFSAAVTWWAN